jgi:mannan endo-1,4-beta-mannosidase
MNNVARRTGRAGSGGPPAGPGWPRASRRPTRRQHRMVARLAMVAAAAVAAAAIVVTVVRFVSPSPAAALAGTALPTGTASYLGVYETGPPQTYEPVAEFAQAVGRAPNLVGYYSGWKEPFQTSFARTVRAHGAVTIVQIDPTYASIAKIAAGGYDSYLRSYADGVRRFGQPVVIGFGHEMNAPWYTWGYGQTPAATFVAAWRHVVTLFRDQGAHNVTWLWTLQADEPGTAPTIAPWWPGSQYVTWVGIDGYYYRPSDTFSSVFGKTITQVRILTGKPVLLSETAVGPQAGQSAKIGDLFNGMREYGTLGLVWFDITQNDGIYHQDWHIEDNPEAATVFRQRASGLNLARVARTGSRK